MVPSVEAFPGADARQLAIGIIGVGGMGSRHAANLHHHVGTARVAAIFDTDAERASRVALRCGGAAIATDPFALISDAGIDAVIIASPDATHAELVLACLRCRKPVLCEKPLAISVEEAASIVEAESALGRRLIGVGLMRRFDPQHLAVREVIASGKLGRPIIYRGVHRNATIPYESTGEVVLTNSAGHDIDAARWLLGQEVEEVYVRGVRSRASYGPETTDALLVQMALSGPCLATIEVFLAAEYGYEVSAEVVAERGTAVTAAPDRALVRCGGTRSAAVPADWLERFEAAYVAELAQWVGSLRAGVPFAGAGAWDGYMALLVTAACVRSLQTGLPAAVRTPAGPGLYRLA